MKVSALFRGHWAALRSLLVLTAIVGIGYPMLIWLVAQIPGLRDEANGSLVEINGRPVASRLIGQLFTDADGAPLPQYFQGRPSAAGTGYDALASGASNLGPESIVDSAGRPSLLTQVCARSRAVGEREGVDGTRPFCTGDGVGAVLSVMGPRDADGRVPAPVRVISVNQPCGTTAAPFLEIYSEVRVECAKPGEDYSAGLIVPIRGSAPRRPAVPADAVTAGASGLDPHISPGYAELQIARVAAARGVRTGDIRAIVAAHSEGRTLGFLGEPRVNVVELNIALDAAYPMRAAGG